MEIEDEKVVANVVEDENEGKIVVDIVMDDKVEGDVV